MLFLVFCVAFTSTAETQKNQMSYDQTGFYEVPNINIIITNGKTASVTEIFDSQKTILIYNDEEITDVTEVQCDNSILNTDSPIIKEDDYPLLCINSAIKIFRLQLISVNNKTFLNAYTKIKEAEYTELGYSLD